MSGPTVTLLTRPGCHLCDDARTVVVAVVERLVDQGRAVVLQERSILEEPALRARWSDDVPVVLVDGRLHTRWRVDPEQLVAELTA